MRNRFIVLLIAAATTGWAQEPPSLLNGFNSSLQLVSGSSAKPSAAQPSKTPAAATEITSTTEASFDQQTRQAVFIGNVRIRHPQFTLNAQKLTAFLKKEATGAHPKSTAESPVKTPDLPGAGEGGIEKVIAEGGVVIIQDKPATEGAAATRYVAKAARAEYDAATGNVTLSGWPQVSQGINMQVATESSTVMILNKDGKMTTTGGSKTVIQDTEKNTPHP